MQKQTFSPHEDFPAFYANSSLIEIPPVEWLGVITGDLSSSS